MKYLNILLTIMAVALLLAALRTSQVVVTLAEIRESNQRLIDTQKAVIASTQHLENTLLDLKEAINKVGDKFGDMVSSSADLEDTITGLKEAISKVGNKFGVK